MKPDPLRKPLSPDKNFVCRFQDVEALQMIEIHPVPPRVTSVSSTASLDSHGASLLKIVPV